MEESPLAGNIDGKASTQGMEIVKKIVTTEPPRTRKGRRILRKRAGASASQSKPKKRLDRLKEGI